MSVSLLIIMLFIVGMLCLVLYHFFIQQSLRDINNRLALLQPAPIHRRGVEVIRRERAHAHDQLVLMEADLVTNPRPNLSSDELENIDKYRKTLKGCIEELKLSGEWMGIPFDFEWTEILDRLPVINVLYRKSAAEVTVFDDLGTVTIEADSAQKRGFKR
jgi:hypothetical protein